MDILLNLADNARRDFLRNVLERMAVYTKPYVGCLWKVEEENGEIVAPKPHGTINFMIFNDSQIALAAGHVIRNGLDRDISPRQHLVSSLCDGEKPQIFSRFPAIFTSNQQEDLGYFKLTFDEDQKVCKKYLGLEQFCYTCDLGEGELVFVQGFPDASFSYSLGKINLMASSPARFVS